MEQSQNDDLNNDRNDDLNDDVEEAVPARRRPSRRVLVLVLAPILIISVVATIARGFRPTLIANYPLLLLAIEPATTHMVLVQERIAPVAFYAVVIVRRLILDPIYFYLGRWYGNTALQWLMRQAPGMGELVASIEKHFPRFGFLIVAIYPQPLVFVIAGASRMRFWVFMLFDALNTVVIVYLVRSLGKAVETPVGGVNNFISQYSIPLTILSIVLVLFFLFQGRRNGKSAVPNISRMASDLEDGSRPTRSGNDSDGGNSGSDSGPIR